MMSSAEGLLSGSITAAGILVAAALLLLTAALQTALIYLRRGKVHVVAGRAGVDRQPFHRSIEERYRLLAAIEIARALAGVAGTALVVYAVVRRAGVAPGPLLVATIIATIAVILLQAVPRAVVRRNPERWGMALAPVSAIYRVLFGPVAWLFELPGQLVLRLLRVPAASERAEEPEEILRLVEIEESSGHIEEDERQMIRGVISLDATTAREIMVPRLDIAAVSTGETISDAVQMIVSRGFSRIPLFEGSIDNIVGILYAKDLLRCLSDNESQAPLPDVARAPHFIPETKKVDDLLRELRRDRVHIAIVVDEYGGTAGIVTIEDLIEEIVGEIEDEYDRGEVSVEVIDADHLIVDGRSSTDVLAEHFGVNVDREDVDTVGGLVYTHLGRIPAAEDEVEVGDLSLTVLSVSRHRIKKVLVARSTLEPSPAVNHHAG